MKPRDYLSRPYHIVLIGDESADGQVGWVASVAEMPGCLAQGDTAPEAAARIYDAMEGWIEDMLRRGKQIPEPSPEPSGGGKLLLRMPGSLHDRLIFEAEKEGVSLNQLCVGLLSGAVGWHLARPMMQAASDVAGKETRSVSEITADAFVAFLRDQVPELERIGWHWEPNPGVGISMPRAANVIRSARSKPAARSD